MNWIATPERGTRNLVRYGADVTLAKQPAYLHQPNRRAVRHRTRNEVVQPTSRGRFEMTQTIQTRRKESARRPLNALSTFSVTGERAPMRQTAGRVPAKPAD